MQTIIPQVHFGKEEEEIRRKLELLNDKYGLDYYSSSESDFKFDHEYTMLV